MLKFLLLWIILLDPPGNISWNKILPNTLRIIMPPATLQKTSGVGYWFQTRGKGFTAAKHRLKCCFYLYHPGWKTDLGEFVLFHVMVMIHKSMAAFHPNRNNFSGQSVSSPSGLLEVMPADLFLIAQVRSDKVFLNCPWMAFLPVKEHPASSVLINSSAHSLQNRAWTLNNSGNINKTLS